MRNLVTITATLLFAQSSIAVADSIRLYGQVPASTRVAGVHDPICGGEMSEIDDVMALMESAADAAISSGEPTAVAVGGVAKAISTNNTLQNRILVAFGQHNGASTCRYVCGTVPETPTNYEICVDGGDGTRCANFNNENYVNWDADYWARAHEVGYEIIKGTYNSCFLLKNWKHNWDRNFTITISY